MKFKIEKPNFLKAKTVALTMSALLSFNYASSQKITKNVKDAPVFSNFTYKGNDNIYNENPLKPDEFYTYSSGLLSRS
jgi:alpha-N-arabinofuranosidase